MSSKSYTMREMKSIVDYLVENKLYGEFKGRKMWMDFANSKLTNRTWQSLKETFVKRVLPDIHNPYYKLTVEQINSFRSGFDIADRNKAKLEVHTISDDSNSNGLTEVNESPASNGNNHERETTTGENIKCSKIPPQNRSSADTIILEPCYETAEEILKELESNGKDLPASSNVRQTSRSLRDCITYSEPLTPMLQEVLDDFASEPEDSDREGPMHIVEAVQVIESTDDLTQMPETDGTIPKLISLATDVVKSATELSIEGTEEVLAQEIVEIIPENTSPQKQVQNVEPRIEETVNKIGESLKDITENGDEEATEHNKQDNSENVAGLVNGSKNYEISGPKGHQPESLFDSENQTNHNSSGGTVDASLPNNPEGFKDKSQKTDNKLKESPEKLKSSGETSSTSDKKPTVSPPKRKRSATVDPKKLTEIEKKRNKLAGKLKGPLKVSKKAKPRAATETAIKIKDDVCETAELKPTNKDIEELMDLDTIQEIDTNKDVTDIEKPSTSFDMEVTNAPEQPETEQSSKENDVPEVTNPCLQNVSLFDEQFNKTKYNMSESSDTEQNKKETSENTQEGISKHDGAAKPNVDVVVQIPSGSDAEQARSPPKKKHRPVVLPSKAERDKAVANMFGQSGGVSSKRRRQLNRRSRTISHNNVAQTAPHSNSSEWTSESESEAFISPPRSRKNRTTRKYLKPRSARILSLEEEGGLFVMYGKKIFPLIKDGKIVKNYLTYVPESDSEEGESYWKQKYEEEKKKASEFKKLLQKVKVPQEIEAKPPVPPDNLLRNLNSINNQVPAITNGNDDQTPFPAEVKQIAPKVHPPEKITIKFTKNNEEVHLEGHWPEIHPVLEQVVHIFHKEVEAPAAAPAPPALPAPPAAPAPGPRASRALPEPNKDRSSGGSTPIIITPIDPEIHEKVNKIEKEIFKEIEQRDKEEETMPSPRAPVNNVTKRSLVDRKQGRPRKSSSSVTLSPPPQTRVVRQSTSKKSLKITASESEVAENVETAKASPRRQIKTPRKLLNESLNINDGKNIQTRRSRQKLDVSSPDDNVKYMLRPKSLRLSKSPPINKPKTKKQKSSNESSKMVPPPHVSLSMNSIDSTQGYQDSDESPVRINLRKKKMLQQSSFKIKTRNSILRSSRRKSYPYIYCDAYDDSSNSSHNGPVEVVLRQNSSPNTDVYRSESYQLLMPQAKNSRSQLEPIDETSPINSNTYFVKPLESISAEEALHNNFMSHSDRASSDIGSSSNISLPMSPELSVVENISISKDILQSMDYYPTINEMQSNDVNQATGCSKYMISDVNVSLPLMEQDCGLENCSSMENVTSPISSTEPKNVITESLVNKIGTINIEEQVTATDTLNQKLHDLLLESAKKIANKESMMDVDDAKDETKKKSRKRCSTPRKRKVTKKSVAPTVEPVLEEHVESCTYSGRKSCPPFFQTFASENVINEEIASLAIDEKKPKGKERRKKDIIRVKIQRPKPKKKSDEKLKAQNASKISIYTDSGINESGVFLPIDDSIDLIHNHSETCLHANDCVGDSVEFIENSKSVITLNDSTKSVNNLWMSRSEYDDAESMLPEFFCNNAQDVHSFFKKTNTEHTSDTVYHSPQGTEMTNNSLITEDLSDDLPPPVKPTKWYLLSDEETNATNPNMIGPGTTLLSVGDASSLKQLFPIACAVPDLSTITEFSNETDSRKPTLDLEGLSADDFNSRMFDSNF